MILREFSDRIVGYDCPFAMPSSGTMRSPDFHALPGMTSTNFLAAALMGLALLGCEPNAPPLTPGEQALINLTEQLKSEGSVTKLVPRYCDGGASGRPKLLCYADVMEPYAGEERKVGFSTYSCDVAPGGHCVIASAAD